MQKTEIIYLLFAYLVAAIPFGVVLSKIVVGQDVRSTGSGNIGATNVSRLMGKKWGIIVLILDALKGYVVVGLAQHVSGVSYVNLVGGVAVLAHCFPIYLKFKGGKGVATTIGVLASLSWTIVGAEIFIFALVCGLSRRISPASLAAALALPFLALFTQTYVMPQLAVLIFLVIWFKHKENILRLIKNQEPKFF